VNRLLDQKKLFNTTLYFFDLSQIALQPLYFAVHATHLTMVYGNHPINSWFGYVPFYQRSTDCTARTVN
jgi:hypothetical protein